VEIRIIENGVAIENNTTPIKKIKLDRLINSAEINLIIEKKKNEQNNS